MNIDAPKIEQFTAMSGKKIPSELYNLDTNEYRSKVKSAWDNYQLNLETEL